MVTLDTKLYVQLEPDTNSLHYLQTIQEQLKVERSARLVPAESIHLTVLHIGLVSRMIAAMEPFTSLATSEIVNRTRRLVDQLESLAKPIKNEMFELEPNGYALFGVNQATLVVTFQTTPELDRLYAKGLDILLSFFTACGIDNPKTFMGQDENFKYALTLRPHVTIAKSYHDGLPVRPLTPLSFTIMPVVY